jgi:hypothetical protein
MPANQLANSPAVARSAQAPLCISLNFRFELPLRPKAQAILCPCFVGIRIAGSEDVCSADEFENLFTFGHLAFES